MYNMPQASNCRKSAPALQAKYANTSPVASFAHFPPKMIENIKLKNTGKTSVHYPLVEYLYQDSITRYVCTGC